MSGKDENPEQLNKATRLTLAWAIQTLERQMPDLGEEGYDPKAWDRDQQRKAQAAAIVASLKVRTDPGALRGQKRDLVADVIAGRIKAADARRRRPKPNTIVKTA